MSSDGLENEFVSALDAKNRQKVRSVRIRRVGNPKQNPSFAAARSTPTVDGCNCPAPAAKPIVCFGGLGRWFHNYLNSSRFFTSATCLSENTASLRSNSPFDNIIKQL
jgi:hypothetical protein